MLTDGAIRKARPKERPYKLSDYGGLYLLVTPTGSRLWRFKYSFHGKEKLLAIGKYPEVVLTAARAARDDAKRSLAAGKDPSIMKRVRAASAALTAATTFEGIAREWHSAQKAMWTKKHIAEVLGSLEADVFPAIGKLPMLEIGPPVVLECLRAIEARDAKVVARRVRQRISAVFVYAIATGRAETDPAAIVKQAMAPIKKGRQPAILDLGKARQILIDAEAKPAHPVSRLALRFLALTVVRPSAMRLAPWSEFDDLDEKKPLWRIPADRMKLSVQNKEDEGRDHWVPLAPQAVEVLKVARSLTGTGPLVFPSVRNAHRPISENTIGYMLNRAGYHSLHVPHGWRSTFSTIMNERFPADRQIIDLMLAHVPKDKVESAYNRAAHLERRRRLAIIWANLLMDGLPPAASLVTLRRKSA